MPPSPNPPHDPTAAPPPACDRALARAQAALAAAPFEDGVAHAAEAWVAEAIAAGGARAIESAMIAGAGADLLRIAGRVSVDPALRRRWVRLGLASSSIDMQDAAVQAAESWGDPALASLLAARTLGPRWLDDYRVCVCAALRASRG